MAQPSLGKNALVILSTDRLEATHTVINEIAALGGRIIRVCPPRILIGDIPAEAEAQVRALANVGRLYRGRVDLSEVDTLGPAAVQAVKAWNRSFAASFRALKSARTSEGKSWGAPGYAPEGPVRPPKGAGEREGPSSPFRDRAAAGLDASAYLIGKVATSILLVEGKAPPYTFSQMERDTVVAEIEDGLDWLATQEPRATVTWFHEVYEISLDLVPSEIADFGEDIWRDAAMAKLGHPANWGGLEKFVQARRTALRTDWAFTILVTRFPLWHFAYAYKPRVVLSYDLDGWGIDNMDRIAAHEACHIFGAGDEYAESRCDCKERWGHLRVENGNCELCAPQHLPCIMGRNTWAMCEYTREQLGWRDSNGDGILDPLDKTPLASHQPWWVQIIKWLLGLFRRLPTGRQAPPACRGDS